MNALVISSFAKTLEKNAAVPQLLQKVWRSGAGRTLAGSAVGAGVGAATDSENRVRGALSGGLLGGIGGYASPLLTSAGRRRALDQTKYLGRKAKYEATGRGVAPTPSGISQKDLIKMRQAEKAGLLSIPSAAKNLATRPVGTVRDAWKHSGTGGKLFAVGDVAMGAPRVFDKNTAEGAGEKALGTLGSATGYLVGGRMGMLGSMAMGTGLGYLGGKAGKVFGGGNKSAKSKSLPITPRTALMREGLEEAAPRVGRLVGPS